MLIAARCRDFADVVFKGSRSAACRGCPVTGHLPVDEIYFSIAEASKTCPDLTETTGLAGEEPLKAQNIPLTGGCSARHRGRCDGGLDRPKPLKMTSELTKQKIST